MITNPRGMLYRKMSLSIQKNFRKLVNLSINLNKLIDWKRLIKMRRHLTHAALHFAVIITL